jgi:hypothetical protein
MILLVVQNHPTSGLIRATDHLINPLFTSDPDLLLLRGRRLFLLCLLAEPYTFLKWMSANHRTGTLAIEDSPTPKLHHLADYDQSFAYD